jgi:hypothetical protein
LRGGGSFNGSTAGSFRPISALAEVAKFDLDEPRKRPLI